jgi:hypothetical protein
MNEREFIKTLRERAREQEKLIKSMPLPRIFSSVSLWFGNHPWRIIVPLAFILTLIFRAFLGTPYENLILSIFGKL